MHSSKQKVRDDLLQKYLNDEFKKFIIEFRSGFEDDYN